MFRAELPARYVSRYARTQRLLFVPVFLIITCSSFRAEQLPVKTYTTADGLARDQINRIVQDSHGFLWFCTVEGLSRFDGYKFTNYTTANGLPNNFITDLLETHDGTYLIATADGLSVFNPSGNRLFTSWRPAEAGAQTINELLEDSKGRIWCGTNGGLYTVEKSNGGLQFHIVELGLKRENFDSWLIEKLMEDSKGSLWIGTRGSGLLRYWQDGRIDHFT
jgi:ligand-binding sensor domain-containing protein